MNDRLKKRLTNLPTTERVLNSNKKISNNGGKIVVVIRIYLIMKCEIELLYAVKSSKEISINLI